MGIRVLWFACCLLVGLWGPGGAAYVVAQQSAVRFDRVSIVEGLSQSSVQCIMQDRLGFMWFGTQDGLNKYDGYNVTIYKSDPLDPHSLSYNSVETILADHEGGLWVGTEGSGLDRFDRGTEQFTHFRHNPEDSTSLSNDVVYALHEDRRGTLWIGTLGGGLNKFIPSTSTALSTGSAEGPDRETERFIRYRHDPNRPNSLSSDWILSLHESRDGMLWIGTDGGGLSRYNPATDDFTSFLFDAADTTTPFSVIIDLDEDPEGTLWLGTPYGLVAFDPQTSRVTRYRHDPANPQSLGSDVVHAVHVDQQGRLWAGTDEGGLNLFDPATETFTRYTHRPLDPNTLGDNTILFLYEDDAEALWVGTDAGGAYRLAHEKSRFTNYRRDPLDPNSLNDSDIWAVFEDHAGILWVGTESGGLNRIDPQTATFTHYTHDPNNPKGMPPGVIGALYESPATPGQLWIGTDGDGLSRLDTRTGWFTHFTYAPDDPHSLSNDLIHTFFEDRAGALWVGTGGGGLNRFDPATERFTRFMHEADSLIYFDVIFAIQEDRAGKIWSATLHGVTRLDPATGQFDYFTHDPTRTDGLSSDFVLSIYEDREGMLWFGTDNGLNKLAAPEAATPETATFTRFTERDGLPNDMIYGVLGDGHGYLWLSTNRGLSRFDPRTEVFRNYNLQDGIQTYEFNAGAYHQSRTGRLYFGGIGGVTSFLPDDIQDNLYIPPVVVTRFTSFDKVVRRDLVAGETLALKHWENFFSFEFAALDYTNPGKNRYAYRMEGIDPDWIEAGTRRYAAYTNLDPGRYTFRVRGSNSDGLWNEEGTALTLTIQPPFWGTWWFRILSALIVAAAAFVWYRSRIRRVERLRDEKIEIQRQITYRLEAERLHLARELHDGPIQSLQLSGFQLKTLSDGLYDAEQHTHLAQLRDNFQRVIRELRAICGDLRPPALAHFGLARAIHSHADQFLTSHPDLNIQLDLMPDADALAGRTRLGLFRIYQEALNNAARHAGPCTVLVRLLLDDERVTLEIQDDGRGFAMPKRWNELAQQQHYGLLGTAERAEAIEGSLHVRSTLEQGTLVRVTAPRRLSKHRQVSAFYPSENIRDR